MNKQQHIINEITGKGLLPLYFHSSQSICIGVLKALYHAGIRAVEYTNRGEAALVNFKAMKGACDAEMPDMCLGIGTVKNAAAAKVFIAAGADFLISPGIAEDIAEVAQHENILWMPGCMTPSEIMHAESFGVKMVKLFPGSVLGAAFVSAVKDVFPGMLFMPTGGVDTTHENLSAWFAAGVSAVGMGSKLLSKKIMEEENYTGISHFTANALQTIAAIR
ncbi:bifunctional 4-hydroxy-2-oxoglutarate aldolase/2-dehydro-3-deoxy-phosphogluconate aldolase [Ilyomonas limi]|uniref:Bifunctional 4-hydroxy-2-oxoglutarate aldolase/2-dehydro-3-deoxy-phosphogluconate aldolase n=1 Tax=Ilyomonas limi TaxID=2575867 RepID=A0A4U3KTI4_9BACT|nr:bifunctional 4-hydroxy-2-oxoglutarate aldolase/2-dehydro-3-deoxy-phosphogluconate aldolase [Ilyomonas limi]TKK65825.1 bifunctional 4-hydroxy-2-oxoglutarate aldolase/2-dehydro-3-deoxy-phosphogluconate aldolase [Ilyomonas limi]